MDKVKIELMREDHLNEVAKIFTDSFNAVGEDWLLENAEKHVRENFFGDAHFVAIKDDQIVGFIMGFPLTREQGLELFIDSIAILPEFQHQGIGKQLWEKMCSLAKENSYVAIRLLTNSHLESFNWYREMGFKESGWVEVFKYLE